MIRLIISTIFCLALAGCASTKPAPVYDRTKINEARTAYSLGDMILAEGLLQQIIGQGTSDPELWVLLGKVYFRQHQFSAAERSFTKAIELESGHRIAARNLAATYIRMATITLIEIQQPLEPNDPLLSWLLALQIKPGVVQKAKL